MIDVSLLGPPRVERDGVLLRLDTRKATALLALLAVTDRPRSRDALADLLWSGADPEHARGALRRTLSALRGGIGAAHLETTSDHVRLLKGPGIRIDVDRFRSCLEAGDNLAAIAVYRGDFLEGFAVRNAVAFEEWAVLESEELRRQLTTALADQTGTHESAGDLAAALTTAQRWLEADPLHEPAHQALIRLYAGTGDRAAALHQYRTCVRTLAEELGVAPLSETTELYEAVTRGVFAPVVPAPPTAVTPPAAPPGVAPLVGRDAELACLRSVYDSTGTDGRVVLVAGEAGIGKTRLVDELLEHVRSRGGRVLSGRAYEDEKGLAYGPVLDMLGTALRHGGWLDRVDVRSVRAAARLLPELAGEAPDPDTGSSPGAQARLLGGLWDTLTTCVAADTVGVLALDDVQWADDATTALLAYGLRRLGGRRVVVVLVSRTPHDHPLLRAASTVVRDGAGTVVRLERLTREDVAALAAYARPSGAGVDRADRLWQRSEGVPLILVEYLRAGPDDSADLPTGLREVLRVRLDPVSETGRQVLSAASVLGRSFSVETVRSVSGRTDEETVTAVEELVRHGLVVEGDPEHDFAHDLLRTLVYEETTLARRRLLHLRAARLPGTPEASVGRHLQLGGRDQEAARAFATAGERARQVFAHAEALDHLRAALTLGHPDRTRLLVAIGDVHTLRGDYAAALRAYETAAAGCRPEELADVEHRLGRLHHRRGDLRLTEAHLRAALDAAGAEQVALRSGITADLSLAVQSGGDTDQAAMLAEQAEALARQAQDPHARCQALNLRGMLAATRGDTESAMTHLESCRTVADELGDLDLRVAVLNNLALTRAARGELDAAQELTLAALDLCTRMGDRHHEAALRNNLADLLHAAGRAEDAMSHLKSAVRIFADIETDGEPEAGIWKLARW